MYMYMYIYIYIYGAYDLLGVVYIVFLLLSFLFFLTRRALGIGSGRQRCEALNPNLCLWP